MLSSVFVFAVNLRWAFDHRDIQLPHHSAAKFAAVQIGSLLLVWAGVALVTALTSSVLLWNVATFLLTIGLGFGRFSLYRGWVYTDHGRQPVDVRPGPSPSPSAPSCAPSPTGGR